LRWRLKNCLCPAWLESQSSQSQMPAYLGMIGTCHCIQLVIEMRSCEHSSQAGFELSLDLSLPRISDYRHEPLELSLKTMCFLEKIFLNDWRSCKILWILCMPRIKKLDIHYLQLSKILWKLWGIDQVLMLNRMKIFTNRPSTVRLP
jgi:hypothetical protein